MIMKNIKYYIMIAVAGIITAFSSCGYLDVDHYFDDDLKYDSIFSNKRYLQGYLWNTASMLPDEGLLFRMPSTLGPLACDEAFTTFSTEEYWGLTFAVGEINESQYKGGLDIWNQMYKIIRKANIILSRMDETPDMTLAEKYEILGYTRFLRAYAYYLILMDYGPVILVGDNVYLNNEPADYYNNFRATYDESVDYICNEFEVAAQYMPQTVLNNQFGRPTKGAAYALIARLRLHQASPLFNGGTVGKKYYSTWTRSTDGVHYISQQYDEKKWAVAAAAAKRVIEMGIYSLHTVERDPSTPALPSSVPTGAFPDGAGDIDGFKSYSDMFTGESMITKIPEYIWARRSANRDICVASFPHLLGGWNGGIGVTQKVIDTYLMADGRTKENSSDEYPYRENEMFSMSSKGFSGYVFTNKKQISGMYVNREPRFYASIGFSGRFWPALSCTKPEYREFTATYDVGGNSGRYDGSDGEKKANYPITGYTITKMIHANDAVKEQGATLYDKSFPVIRYAEILLSYAEALNNLTQSHTITLGEDKYAYTTTVVRDGKEIKDAFNQVRYRVTLPGITDADVSDVDRLQKLIEKERMIEFLFENRRFYDVRRWGIYEETESEPMLGMNIEASEPDYYNRTFLNHRNARNRVVDKKMIFLPIPRDEIRKLPSCDQNIGWGS